MFKTPKQPTEKERAFGFTIIELLVVVTIIAVLSAVGMVLFTNAGKNARDAKRKADLESIRQALVLYKSDNNCYPTEGNMDMSSGDPLVSEGYISAPFPKDPKSPTWSYSYSTTGAASVSCKSGSGVDSFTLSAQLESDGSSYTIKSP